MGDGSWSTGVETVDQSLPPLYRFRADDASQFSRDGGGSCQQRLGFRIGLGIASLNVIGLQGLGEVELLLIDLCIHVFALNETKLDSPKGIVRYSGLSAVPTR